MQWTILHMCKLVNTERGQWNGEKPQGHETRLLKVILT